MLIAALAEAVGARSTSKELLEYFLRVGQGDVGKAAALYCTVADEFVELRDVAR